MIRPIGLLDTARNYISQFNIIYTYTHTCPQSRLHCRYFVETSNKGSSTSYGFPNGPRLSLSEQQLTATEAKRLSDSLTRVVSLRCQRQSPLIIERSDALQCGEHHLHHQVCNTQSTVEVKCRN